MILQSEDPSMSDSKTQLPTTPYDGWKTGDTIEDVASCLGGAIDHLEVEMHANASPQVMSAIWRIAQAVRKLEAGEAFTLRELEVTKLDGLLAEIETRAAADKATATS
jgi:hypothetical protein